MASTLPQPPASAGKPMMNVSYETFAPRSAAQITRLQRIAALTAGPTAGPEEKSEDVAWTLAECMSPFPTESRLQERGPVQSTLKKTLQVSDQVTSLLKHTTSMRLALRASINIAEDISNRHAELLRHSGELSAAADRLQAEEAQLSRHAEEIGMPLQHYDAVDRIGVLVGVLFKGRTTVRGLAKIKVDNDEYPSLLDEIDEAVDFFGHECGGKEALQIAERHRNDGVQSMSGSMEYYRRSLALQEAALYLIREAVVDRVSQTTSDVASLLNVAKIPIAADKLEASLVYTRFHGISARTNRLMLLVRNRLDRGEPYHELLTLCRNNYCASRESLLKLTLRAHMDTLRDQHGLVGMTRLASVFLIRLCTVETSLYLDFFGDKKEGLGEGGRTSVDASSLASQVMSDEGTYYDSDFQTYLNNLCNSLHRTVRRGLVTVLDLDTLCQIVSVLREERSMASTSPTTMAAARAISTVIEDAQERLIFCANNALSKEVVRFRPAPDDLDYPAKLMTKTMESSRETEEDEDAVEKQLQVYESWFSPMRSVLRILSKIFRVVEARVFEDIARDSVQACIRCLKDGSSYILQKSGVVHADLFLVKHLLILREQLSPFDIELRSVERQLDFSDAGKAVSRFLANRNRQLFSMSTENALVTLLREGVSVQEANVDSKRDLEDALRSACNDFIEHTSQNAARDLLHFGAQCKSTGDNAVNQAFMKGDVVKAMLESTARTVEAQLAEVTSQMSLYLDNAATQSILLKPVSRKITRTMEDAKRFVQKSSDGVNGWDPEVRTSVVTLMNQIESTVKQSTKTAAAK